MVDSGSTNRFVRRISGWKQLDRKVFEPQFGLSKRDRPVHLAIASTFSSLAQGRCDGEVNGARGMFRENGR